jgi:hypothetical protein
MKVLCEGCGGLSMLAHWWSMQKCGYPSIALEHSLFWMYRSPPVCLYRLATAIVEDLHGATKCLVGDTTLSLCSSWHKLVSRAVRIVHCWGELGLYVCRKRYYSRVQEFQGAWHSQDLHCRQCKYLTLCGFLLFFWCQFWLWGNQ